jgi:thiol-disulfide isomerase/thioredoxin
MNMPQHKEERHMTLTPSMMPPLETPAPDFDLPDSASGNKILSLHDFDDSRVLLVAFMSQHCPYTLHILPKFLDVVHEYQPKGMAVVVINANDSAQHREDRPGEMAQAAKEMKFSFPFLFDESQETAKAFQAACTPDFFLYDKARRLFYRGRFDDSRPDSGTPVTGDQLRAAIEAALAGHAPPKIQKPSVGCNIKWKPGNEPDYFFRQQQRYA